MANSFHQVMTHFNLYGILIIKNLKEGNQTFQVLDTCIQN